MSAPRNGHEERGTDPRPENPKRLPRQRRGVVPQMRGRYPDWDVLTQVDHWDEVTRRVVLARVDDVPPIRFFDESEVRSLGTFCDAVMAQTEEPRIPVLSFIDDKLFCGRSEGFQYASMPDDQETWRLLARGLDERARSLEATSFAEAGVDVCIRIIGELQRGELSGGVWERLDPQLTWKVVMSSVLDAFYSHPWAWNEIGFGGPAYPRGYARLGVGLKEAWEGEEAFELDPVRDVDERGLDL
ncbi:MAG: gluconate 2-dehydrogenase subunit 3 family protein [Gemmatimonadetes bacterium]|nr:gluconate 2-dehydrogenase subunit 3 family protein [Gemmatimonadota bacterium]